MTSFVDYPKWWSFDLVSSINNLVLQVTGAIAINETSHVQTLWSGYGEIRRYYLDGGKFSSVIVKHIQLPEKTNHPRGWNTSLSHQRKLKSYQVECNWYQKYAPQSKNGCRLPECYHILQGENEVILVMEDLDASGFNRRLDPSSVNLNDVKNCLSWLASFHATYFQVDPEGLWETGTYWHLDTRPDEFDQMQNLPLKGVAYKIDSTLNQSKHQTLLHGDAKLANFCFGKAGDVAAVDFQYVGRGCGMKDVAYLISSCFDEEECERYEEELLNHYFSQLKLSMDNSLDFQSVMTEWKSLYKYAWADFYRFLDGWSPGHWKMHDYSKRITQKVIDELK